MSDKLFGSLVTIATALIGVAIISVLVSQQANTSAVIKAATGGFAQDLSTAISPVTGGSGSSISVPSIMT